MSIKEYFFPAEPVVNDTEPAKLIRSTIGLVIVGHIVVAVAALIFVSIFTFLGQFIFIAILYSTYQTLHTW